MTMIHYLAYGSNLHPLRLRARIPSAELIGAVLVPGHRLVFDKRSDRDGSGKCTLIAANDDTAHGALYRMARAHRDRLDEIEGVGYGYDRGDITVEYESRRYDCFTYFAQPNHLHADLQPHDWYKELVVRGARHLQFPAAYIAAIESVEAKVDRDESRRKIEDDLLNQIKLNC